MRKHVWAEAPLVLAERSETDYESGCIIWKNHINHDGYGRLKFGGKLIMAHRLMYEYQCGKLRDGMEIDHTCCNRACINVDHMEPVTHVENIQRGHMRRRLREQAC